ncbi:uncharacterized protein LOC118491083 [Helianthus annuus]|uniref:uncharacterized protein LOC118491083 n=1 Tax=Helianthus annuus TaxID=4232 RepID=UPI001652EBB8|nr:uncharacterized protein LOC118491083 [Helianthus annuus]
MPPRRDQTQDAAMAAMIAQQIAAVLPNLVTQLNQANNNNNNNVPVLCNFKTFNSAKPLQFSGSEGAIGLLQWFESLENTFRHVQCPNGRKVKFASSVFQKRALTWWNGVMRDRSADVAMAQTWEEVRALIMKEFCPRHELRALEDEFHDLKQDSGEHRAYTDRYEELSLLCPTMVTPLDKAIEKYIDGLPDPVQDIVTGNNPTTVRQAIELAATLTESQTKKKKGKKAETSKKSRKCKASQNFAVIAQPNQNTQNHPTQPPAKKQYVGTAPLCNKCNCHHQPHLQCRLNNNFGRNGHLANTCRSPPAPNQAAQNPAQQPANPARPPFPPGSCYNCGDLTHYKNKCPKLANANPARGRAYNINANEARADNEVVNGTFYSFLFGCRQEFCIPSF